MARIFRISGYFVDKDSTTYTKEEFEDILTVMIGEEFPLGIFQQLHIEESEEFKPEGELEPDCDLSLLTKHFKYNNTNDVFDRPLPEKEQQYRHFKLGKIVTVLGIARQTETEELTVIYEYEGDIWSRPVGMFMSKVEKWKYPDAKQEYRFKLVESCTGATDQYSVDSRR